MKTIAVLVLVASCAAPATDTRTGHTPEPSKAPVATVPVRVPSYVLNPAVTQATIRTTICVPGWTAKVRPPASYTNRLKSRQLKGRDPAGYEEDHVMPLALGGAPRDPRNLIPQPWPQAKVKDRDETRLHREVCRGTISLARARAQMWATWRKVLTGS